MNGKNEKLAAPASCVCVPNARIIALNNTFKVHYHGIGVRNSFESGKLEVWNNIIYNSSSAYWS